MKQRLLNNFDLKILAVLLSIVVWIIVVNIDDPVKSIQFSDIPIQFTNESVLTEQNEVYEVVDGVQNVDVVVTGRRSVIEDLSKENISVTADFQKMNEDGSIPLKVTSNKHSNDIDGMKSLFENVEVTIESVKKIQKVIRIDTIGKPADGYIIGDCSLNLNQVNIEGPQSVVESIATAKVQVDVSNASENMSISAPISLYTASGEMVDTSRLKLNIDSVSVNQDILYKKTVSVVCSPSGTPAEGYKTTGRTEINPSQIEIAGKKSTIDSINQITVPSSAVNISEQKGTYRASFDISDYLPNGVKLAQKDEEEIEVVVYIEKEVEETISVSTTRVNVNNLPEGFKTEILGGSANVSDGKIEITAIGLAEDVENLTVSDVELTVDIEKYLKDNNLSVLREGIINVPLEVSLPSGVKNGEEITLRIRVSAT